MRPTFPGGVDPFAGLVNFVELLLQLQSKFLFVFGTKTTHCVPGFAPLSETAI